MGRRSKRMLMSRKKLVMHEMKKLGNFQQAYFGAHRHCLWDHDDQLSEFRACHQLLRARPSGTAEKCD